MSDDGLLRAAECPDNCKGHIRPTHIVDDDGFFLAYEDSGDKIGELFSACAFIFKVEIARTNSTLQVSIGPQQLSKLDDCGRAFPDQVRVSSFP